MDNAVQANGPCCHTSALWKESRPSIPAYGLWTRARCHVDSCCQHFAPSEPCFARGAFASIYKKHHLTSYLLVVFHIDLRHYSVLLILPIKSFSVRRRAAQQGEEQIQLDITSMPSRLFGNHTHERSRMSNTRGQAFPTEGLESQTAPSCPPRHGQSSTQSCPKGS